MRLALLVVTTVIATIAPVIVHGQETSTTCADFAPPAQFKGTKIFNSLSGDYLPLKGVNYYPRPNDGPLVQSNSVDFYTEEYRAVWERDIAEFQQLRVNSIRLYAVDPGKNHDAFMCALKAAGIYVIVGLAADCENCSISKDDPPTCYSPELKTRGQFIIQQFAKYENVLAFNSGNEIELNAIQYLGNVPCQKQFTRDMRAYIRGCTTDGAMRHIPVGVIMADLDRQVKAQYYNCLTSDSSGTLDLAEFIGINSYLHCDGTATSIDDLIGYKTLLADFKSFGMTVPVLVTEYGCLNESFQQMAGYEAQRNFLQTDAIFSPEYREVFNGGFVFEYSTEKIYSQSPFPFVTFGAGNAGVGFFQPEDCDEVDIPCEYVQFPQFGVLAAKHGAVDTSDEPSFADYIPPAQDPPSCPDQFPLLSSFVWPSDSVGDQTCPVRVPVFCTGVPAECVTETLPPIAAASNASLTTSPTNATDDAILTKAPTPRPTTKSPALAATRTTKPASTPSTARTKTALPLANPTMVPSVAPTQYTYKPADFLTAPKSQLSSATGRVHLSGSGGCLQLSMCVSILLFIIT